MLRQILREPLVHFVVAGGILFGAWSWVGPKEETGSGDNVIVLDQARLDHLETLWKAQWKRDPAPEDVAAIVDRHLRQEVFYREALRMELDRDDEIVRTRLAQKMEAVASDLGALMRPPTEDDLRTFHAKRADLFTLPLAFAFRQVLYLPSETADDRLGATLAALRAGGDVPPDRQDKLAMPLDWPLTPAPALENAFGGGFAAALAEVPVGQWSGPVRSGLGLHLVEVTGSEPARLAPFEDIRDHVAQQYDYYAVLDAQERMFRELLAKYDVRIEAGVPDAVMRDYVRQ